MNRISRHGFTLVEVLVALAVVSIALSTLLVTLQQQIDNSMYLRDKMLAKYVSTNKLSEFRLISSAGREMSLGTEFGSTEMAGRTWRWKLDLVATEQPEIIRVSIAVDDSSRGDETPLHTLDAFFNVKRMAYLGG